LQLIGDTEGSEEESTAALKPTNINKNRFPNIVPCKSCLFGQMINVKAGANVASCTFALAFASAVMLHFA